MNDSIYTTWAKLLKKGRGIVEDEHRSDATVTSRNERTNESMQYLIDEVPSSKLRLTYSLAHFFLFIKYYKKKKHAPKVMYRVASLCDYGRSKTPEGVLYKKKISQLFSFNGIVINA